MLTNSRFVCYYNTRYCLCIVTRIMSDKLNIQWRWHDGCHARYRFWDNQFCTLEVGERDYIYVTSATCLSMIQFSQTWAKVASGNNNTLLCFAVNMLLSRMQVKQMSTWRIYTERWDITTLTATPSTAWQMSILGWEFCTTLQDNISGQ